MAKVSGWCCEECGEPWDPLPTHPGQCRRCGNRTWSAITDPIGSSSDHAVEYPQGQS